MAECYLLVDVLLYDVKLFDAVVPTLKLALEQNWDYCAMGIQQVTLRDPVFTRRGDFVCELDLFAGESVELLLVFGSL